jgi:hypothetical protein
LRSGKLRLSRFAGKHGACFISKPGLLGGSEPEEAKTAGRKIILAGLTLLKSAGFPARPLGFLHIQAKPLGVDSFPYAGRVFRRREAYRSDTAGKDAFFKTTADLFLSTKEGEHPEYREHTFFNPVIVKEPSCLKI